MESPPAIVPIRPRGQEGRDGGDVVLIVERPHLRIEPGVYEAVSKRISLRDGFRRKFLEAGLSTCSRGTSRTAW